MFVAVIGKQLGSVTLNSRSLMRSQVPIRHTPFDASSALFQVPNQSQPQLTDNPMPTEISEAIRRLDDR